MSNARFSVIQSKAVKDKRISDPQFRTLAALGMYADEDGWCFPSLTTLGSDLGKSKQAVGRDTIALKKSGYLETQARYNKDGSRSSNLYRLKFDFKINLPRQPDVDAPSTPDVDVNEVVVAVDTSKLYTAYSNEIGVITTFIADSIDGWSKDVDPEWIISAIHEAASQNKRNWKYCAAILKRWQAQGFKDDGKPKEQSQPQPPEKKTKLVYVDGHATFVEA